MGELKPGMRFEMTYKKHHSTLEVRQDGYYILAGSEFPAETQPEFAVNHPHSAKMREQLVQRGDIARTNSSTLRAARDIRFTSPSTASSVLRGGPGERSHWKKGPDNKSLRVIENYVSDLAPLPNIPPATLRAIERRFHKLIRQRAGNLIEASKVVLPRLSNYSHEKRESDGRLWLPIPGMYGGFVYELVGEGTSAKLVTESWSRVVGGSGQKHEITEGNTILVEEGFV
jgi:hypothetical protein